jgi:hypothetical protein
VDVQQTKNVKMSPVIYNKACVLVCHCARANSVSHRGQFVVPSCKHVAKVFKINREGFKMKRIGLLMFLLAVLVLLVSPSLMKSNDAKNGHSFTFRKSAYDLVNNKYMGYVEKVSVKSDGSGAHSLTSTTDLNGQTISLGGAYIINRATGEMTMLSPVLNAKITFAAKREGRSFAPANCTKIFPGAKLLARQEIFGLNAETYELPMEKEVVSTYTVSTSLSCEVLNYTHKHVGSSGNVTELDVGELIAYKARVDASLFTVPSGYTEMSPKQAEAKYDMRTGVSAAAECSSCVHESVAKMEDWYRSRKPIR